MPPKRDSGSSKRNRFSQEKQVPSLYDPLRLPPQNTDAEKALLGALMISPEAIYEIADVVTAEAFYLGNHRTIFETMLDIHSKLTPIDLVTTSNRLAELQQIEAVGGRAYLTELVAASVSPGSAKHYAEIVQSKYLLRRLIDAGHKISEFGYEQERDVAEIIDEAEREVFKVSDISAIRKFARIKEELSEAWDRLEHLQKREDAMRGVPSGFRALDNLLSGFQESDLIILAARPSMGKTALALDIARKAATQHKKAVGIFSLEMSSQQLVDRMLAAEAGVDSWKLRTGRIKSDEDFSNLQMAMATLSEAPIFIDDQASTTVLGMRSIARRLKAEHDLKMIIVDYLQLITPMSNKNDNVVQQVTEISRSLKAMARELKVPVIALSQLSRAVEQRRGRPRLSDLRDSGSIEQDADVVMFIHREDKMNADTGAVKTNVAEILIEKHRNGPTGKVDLLFDEEKTTFRSVDKTDWGDIASETKVEDAPF